MPDENEAAYEINSHIPPKGTKCNCGHTIEVHGTAGKMCSACPCKTFITPLHQEPTIPPPIDKSDIFNCPNCGKPLKQQFSEDPDTGDYTEYTGMYDCENTECIGSLQFFDPKRPKESTI